MHSSILARRILWTEEPGGLQSIGFQRAGHNYSDSACIVKVQPFSFQKFSYRHTANEEPYIEENLLNLSNTNQSLFFESQCTAFISHRPLCAWVHECDQQVRSISPPSSQSRNMESN